MSATPTLTQANAPKLPVYAGYDGPRSVTRANYAADVLDCLSRWVTDPKDKAELTRTARTLRSNAEYNLEEEWPK